MRTSHRQSQVTVQRTEYVHAASAFRTERAVLYLRELRTASRIRRLWRLAGRGFVLRSAFRLHVLRDEPPVRTHPALNQRLGIIDKRIRQRVVACIAHGEGLPFAQQYEVPLRELYRQRPAAGFVYR